MQHVVSNSCRRGSRLSNVLVPLTKMQHDAAVINIKRAINCLSKLPKEATRCSAAPRRQDATSCLFTLRCNRLLSNAGRLMLLFSSSYFSSSSSSYKRLCFIPLPPPLIPLLLQRGHAFPLLFCYDRHTHTYTHAPIWDDWTPQQSRRMRRFGRVKQRPSVRAVSAGEQRGRSQQ